MDGVARPNSERSRCVVTPGVGNVFFTPEQLRLVGETAGAGGRIELNSFMQLIVHSNHEDVEDKQDRLRAAGLGVYPAGAVVKNLHTCTFCMGERVEGLPDARALDEAIAGSPVPYPVRVGFSGCANNCGEALLRDIGVVRMEHGHYDLYIGGRAGGLSPQPGIQVAQAVRAIDLPHAVSAILSVYRGQARRKERFWKNINRVGAGPYRTALQPFVCNEPSSNDVTP